MTERRFAGRLFGPGLPGAGMNASGCWTESGALRVSAPDTQMAEFPSGTLEIAAAGFNDAGLRISWEGPNGAYAFTIEAEVECRACAASAPPCLNVRLATASGRRSRLERRFRLGWLLLALILILPLIGIGAFLLNSDRIADWAMAHISPRHEARLGDLVLAQTRLQMKIIDHGPAVDALSSIGGRLTAGSPRNYRWFVAERPEVNAFAAPGGVVVVFSGLLRSAGTAEELAGVLAHEVAHVELRHSLRGMIKSLGLRALVALVIGDTSRGAFADAATRLTELRFSREAEQEADDEGLRRLVAARIDPNGMLDFYEKLAGEKRFAPPAILSTHPASGERLLRLRTKVAGLTQIWIPLPVDLETIKKNIR